MTKVKVLTRSGHYFVETVENIYEGEVILELAGSVESSPSKYSIQIDQNKHLLPYSDQMDDERSIWRFLNHSCDANSFIDTDKKLLISLKDINPNEEITINYCATEYKMAVPFACRCRSSNCYDQIRGFRYLTEGQKSKINAILSSYLKSLL